MRRHSAVIHEVEHDRFPSSALTVAACGAGGVGFVAASGLAGGFFGVSDAGWLVAGGGVAVVGAAAGALGRWWSTRKTVTDIASERHAARHDALTGLVNRAELYRELEESLVWAARDKTVVGVLFLDLNKFKIVNDTLGHDAGDELLKVVAARLRATIRSTDVVARLGGDEFVVVCRDLLVGDSVLNVASQIQRRFREPVALGSTLHEVGASIGIAIAGPGDRRSPEDLLRDADAAMYTAKRERAPYKVFDDSHRSHLADQAAVETELTRALAEDQFVVFYQPVLDVVEHDLVGYEALLRWRHPERGLIEPKDFLPAADRVGIMPRLGATVLREVCAQIAVWNHLNPAARNLRVSVNLAEQQLTDPNFALELGELLQWSDVAPSQIVVEVSERLMSSHVEELDVLRQLRELGVTVAIDGFGTGGLSFSHAHSLDMAGIVKIDRSFVRGLPHDEVALSVVEAIVAMARPLGLTVLAEGVERPEQLDLLRAAGIRLMQGYLFNAPDYAEVVDPGRWFEAWGAPEDPTIGLLPAVT